jgi:TetR/AcrR family transcriptional repressor of mexJK operon
MPGDKAQAVLKAASAIFLKHGFSGATTDMIQREAGVSKSTVYAHYANKEALFVAVIETQCAGFTGAVLQPQFQPGALRDSLTRIGRTYLEIVLAPKTLALFRVVIAEAPRFPQLARTFYLAGPRVIVAMLVNHLAQASERGEIDASVVGLESAANLFSSLLRGEAQLQCLTHPDATPSAAQMDHWVDIAVTTFLRAYGLPRAA